jgi:hypothetical protein
MARVVEHLPSKKEALNSNPTTTIKRKAKKKLGQGHIVTLYTLFATLM